jgi:Helix-turn-helix domain
MLRVGGEEEQGHGPLGDGRTLANWWLSGSVYFEPPPEPPPAPAPSAPEAPPAKTPPEERELLTIKQLVAYSALSERTLRGYIHRKVRPLPSYRVDKKILIRKVEFDEWLASFRRAEQVDEIDQAVNEMLSGLTGPRPPADTRRHPMRRS